MKLSASKSVFFIIALTACIGFLIGKLDPDKFMLLAGMAFGFYFSFKGESGQPYAGK